MSSTWGAIEVVAKKKLTRRRSLQMMVEKENWGGGIESKVEDIRTAAAIDAGVSVVDPQHQQRSEVGS